MANTAGQWHALQVAAIIWPTLLFFFPLPPSHLPTPYLCTCMQAEEMAFTLVAFLRRMECTAAGRDFNGSPRVSHRHQPSPHARWDFMADTAGSFHALMWLLLWPTPQAAVTLLVMANTARAPIPRSNLANMANTAGYRHTLQSLIF